LNLEKKWIWGVVSVAFTILKDFFKPRISATGHLGGLLGGLAYAFAFGPRLILKRAYGRALLVNRPLAPTALAGLLKRLGRLLRSTRKGAGSWMKDARRRVRRWWALGWL
jgi:hypothetical protein